MSPRAWLILPISLWLAGCALFGDEEDVTRGWSAQKLFVEATEALREGDYETAVKYYEKLEARYPFGKYATQAQLNIAYAYYRFDEPESALAALDRFLRLYPNHRATAYAWYLRGLVNFNRSLTFLDRFIPTDTSQRDTGASMEAYNDFATVVRRFSDSVYVEDARKRMLHLRNNIARHEVDVAEYYMKRGAFVAAANRANYVIENYQRTPAVKDALEIMIAAYTKLELPRLAQGAQRVLVLNEAEGNLIPDPLEIQEKSLGRRVWDYFGLDED
jgi:outer membrane protein assembly factor BamD